MTKAAKVGLGIILGLIVVIAGAIYIYDQSEENELRRARGQLELEQIHQEHEQEMQRLQVQYAETTVGPVSAHHLELCYMQGFPTGGGTRPANSSMSRREWAECQAIIAAMHKAQAQQEAAKRRADAAYDKAHPVK